MDVPLVLIAHDLSPADMLQFKQSVFAGFVTDVGGKHLAHRDRGAQPGHSRGGRARAAPASWCARTTGSSSTAMPA